MVFLFLRRESAAQLKLRAKDAASVDDADIAAVEALLQVVTDEDEDEAYTYEPRSPRHTARSVTFDFEIKTEDEDEGSLSSFGNPSSRRDSYSPPPEPTWQETPAKQLVVEVPALSPEERETYNGSPAKAKRLSTSKAAPARRTTARRRISAEVPVARDVAPPRLSSARKPRAAAATTERDETVRSGKRRKVSVEPEVEAAPEPAPAPAPRETRPRRSIRRTISANTDDVSTSEAPAPKLATRGRARKLVPVVEETPPTTQPQRISPRKPRV